MTLSLKTFIGDFLWVIRYMITIIMYSIIIILLIALVLLGAYFVDNKINERSGESRPPLYGAYVIITTSMIPIIKPNDAIVIKRVDAENIQVGDVITYKSEEPSYYGILITHRVIEIYEEEGVKKYLTKGDYNSTPDPHGITYNQVYGKVIVRIPKVGYLQSFLASKAGWIIAIVLPCIYIVVSSFIDVIKKVSNSHREKRLRRREMMMIEKC